MAPTDTSLPAQEELADLPYSFLHKNADDSYTYRSDAPADIWSFLNDIEDEPQLALRVTVLQLTLEYDGAENSGVYDFIKEQAVLIDTTRQTEQVGIP
jgi:hypothetical protein